LALEAFTVNQKTILSVDFDRGSTCIQKCDYCYVNNMERIYPTYLAKIRRNTKMVERRPEEFARKLNEEYEDAKKSRAKAFDRLDHLPIRLYGSGDFIPQHLKFIKNLDFKFFMFSKNLIRKEYEGYLGAFLQDIPNLTRINLSFDLSNLGNYQGIVNTFGSYSKLGLCFTAHQMTLQN